MLLLLCGGGGSVIVFLTDLMRSLFCKALIHKKLVKSRYTQSFIERKNENHTMVVFIAASYHMANAIIIVVMISRKKKLHFKSHKPHCTKEQKTNKLPPQRKNDNSIVGADKRLFIIITTTPISTKKYIDCVRVRKNVSNILLSFLKNHSYIY